MSAAAIGFPPSLRLPNGRRDKMGLVCPYCAGDTGVTDSRAASYSTVRRRRICFSCQKRFTTFEVIADANPFTNADALRKAAETLRDAADRIERMAEGDGA